MEERLTDYLLALAGLTALVGNRITWTVRPQASALPAIVLHRIDGLPDYTMAGPSGLVSSRIQVDCWGSTYGSVKAVGRLVIEHLSGLDVRLGDGASPETFTTLRGGFLDGDRDGFERGVANEDLYRVSLDLIIWHGQG